MIEIKNTKSLLQDQHTK